MSCNVLQYFIADFYCQMFYQILTYSNAEIAEINRESPTDNDPAFAELGGFEDSIVFKGFFPNMR